MNSFHMLKSSLRYLVIWVALPVLVAIFFAAVGSSKAEAYTCAVSNNGSGTFTTGSNYTGNLQYLNGNCVVMKPVEQGPLATPAGCVDPTQKRHDDGYCWKYQPEYTNLKPTYDDGSEVPISTWEGMCGQNRHIGQGSDGPMVYDSNHHRCATEEMGGLYNGCLSADNNDIYNNNGNACTEIDDTAKNLAAEDLYKDESGAKVAECTNAKATWNYSTKQCNWTEQTCGAKNGGQGRWVDGRCEAYTDYTNQQQCEQNGGEWLQNPNDASHFQCQKPGTDFKDGEDEGEAEGANGQIGQVVDTCGKARVNILTCEAGPNEPAKVFSGILRIAIIALTMVVGAAALAGLVWSALQYARASDEQSVVSDARNRIKNIVIGLFLYGFIIAIANFLIPGGVIGGGGGGWFGGP